MVYNFINFPSFKFSHTRKKKDFVLSFKKKKRFLERKNKMAKYLLNYYLLFSAKIELITDSINDTAKLPYNILNTYLIKQSDTYVYARHYKIKTNIHEDIKTFIS